jgi:hypothetical protein
VTTLDYRFCDERGEHGFGWIVDESMTRTSHALAAGGRVWLVDPVDWPDAIDRALTLGEPAGVLQLLDRHNRDCAALADRLGVPRLVAPDDVPGSPFRCVPVMRRKRWAETALWWAEERTVVVAEAVGTNRFFTAGKAPVGVHVFLRLTPPNVLGQLGPAQLLVGHGEGLYGPGTADALARALATARRGLPGVLLRLPLARRP